MPINLFLTSLFLTIIFILVLFPCALKFGFVDKPCIRKRHTNPTPPIGGIAIFLGVLLTLWFYDINLPQQTAFILAMTLLVIVGAIDDHVNLNVKIRLTAQIFAALIMTEIADIKIIDMGTLFGNGTVYLEGFSTILTVFAVVGGINAFNMIDGIDGLSGSSSLISISLVALLAVFYNQPLIVHIGLLFIGAISAFLIFNLRIFGRKKGLIFLGDSGSTLLGYVICWLIISASQGEQRIIPPVLVLWLIAVPLFDSICIMLRRIQKGKSPFAPDREHLHHILPLKGFSVNQTLITILTVSLVMALTAITASLFFMVPDQLLFVVFLLFFTLFYWVMHQNTKVITDELPENELAKNK